MRNRGWHKLAIELKQQGLSNYEIARQIFGKPSKESTLRYFFNQPNIKSQITKIDTCKMLFWDIEITPFLSFHFDKWGVNIGNDHHVTEQYLISHAWAWGLDGEIEAGVLTSQQAKDNDDFALVEQAWHLLDNADVVVAHNGIRFDVKVMNGFFLRHGLPPPSPYKVIDTFRMAKKNFKLTSNSLKYLAKMLGVQQKLDSGGIQAWAGAYFGVQEDLDNMVEYNKGDIETLRQVYLKLRAWGGSGVNLGMYSKHSAVCPNCASDDIVVVEDAHHVTSVSKFQVIHCNSCNGKSRLRKREHHEVNVTPIR